MIFKRMRSIPYRLVCHELPGDLRHLDLFLLCYSKEFLYSYELEAAFEKEFIRKKNAKKGEIPLWGVSNGRLRALSTEKKSTFPPLFPSKEKGGLFLWELIPKPKHRLEYWVYSGPISSKGGHIRGLGYGKIFL